MNDASPPSDDPEAPGAEPTSPTSQPEINPFEAALDNPQSVVPSARPIKRATLAPYWAKLYGRALVLPGESKIAYWRIFSGLKPKRGLGGFEDYLTKEMTDALMLKRRWRSASTAILQSRKQYLEGEVRANSKPEESSLPRIRSADEILKSVPVSSREAKALLVHLGMTPVTTLALSLLQTQELRDELRGHEEAAERSYTRAFELLERIQEARIHIAERQAFVSHIEERTKHSFYIQRPNPTLPQERKTHSGVINNPGLPKIIDGSVFTEWGRSLLGELPLLSGQAESEYVDLYRAIERVFGYAEQWDPILINDVAYYTWEIRRIREASERLFGLFYRARSKQLVASGALPVEELASLETASREALREAGISEGQVSALASSDLSSILSALDSEIDQLEQRRQCAIKALIASRSRSMKKNRSKAGLTEYQRKQEWAARDKAIAFRKKYGYGDHA